MIAHDTHHTLIDGAPLMAERHLHALGGDKSTGIIRTVLQLVHHDTHQLFHNTQRLTVVLRIDDTTNKFPGVLVPIQSVCFFVIHIMVL